MPEFKLVNPLIIGQFNKEVTADTPEVAAKETWTALSKYIVGDVPNFGFSLQRGGDNKLFHFIVKETKQDGKEASFTIEQLESHPKDLDEKKFIKHIESVKNEISNSQAGGKKHRYDNVSNDDDSSSSSSTDSIYERAKLFKQKSNFYSTSQPMMYWWYSPLLYAKLEPKYTSYFIPTFVRPLVPYVEIDLNSAWFGL